MLVKIPGCRLASVLVFVFVLSLVVSPVLTIGASPGETPLEADFTAEPLFGRFPLEVSFSDQSAGNPTGWTWYFGDEDFQKPWELVSNLPSARISHTSVVLSDGSIVLMGGNDGSHKNDVWRSTDNGSSWNQITHAAQWSARGYHTSVVLPDGSIVLMGGTDGSYRNDVWRSENGGTSWTLATGAALWSARRDHTSVVLPNGHIVLMGGWDGDYKNDVWRSENGGASWTLVTGAAQWSARSWHTSVVLPDGSIVLMGGHVPGSLINDVWRSTDNGLTWTELTGIAQWSARYGHTSVVLPDGSIVLMGGLSGSSGVIKNDVWRSTDKGATWTEFDPTALDHWAPRYDYTSVVLPDGSIVLMGGLDGIRKSDVWRWETAGSYEQNPSHTYTGPGTYQVTLHAYNDTKASTVSREVELAVGADVVINAVPAEGGTVTGSGTYKVGSVAELDAIPADGYRFVQWLEDGREICTEAKLDYTVIADATITAVFWPYDDVRTDSKTGVDISDESVELDFHDSKVNMVITSPEEITGGQIDVTLYQEDPEKGTAPGMVSGGIYLRILRTDHFVGSTVRIEISYDPEALPLGVKADSLKLYRYTFSEDTDSWEWAALPLQGVNLEQNYIWAELSEFSTFGIFGEATDLPITSGPLPAYYLLGMLLLAAGYQLLKRCLPVTG